MPVVQLVRHFEVDFEDVSRSWFGEAATTLLKAGLPINKKERMLCKQGDKYDKLVTLCRLLYRWMDTYHTVFPVDNGEHTIRIFVCTDEHEVLDGLSHAVGQSLGHRIYRPPKAVMEWLDNAAIIHVYIDLHERPPKER